MKKPSKFGIEMQPRSCCMKLWTGQMIHQDPKNPHELWVHELFGIYNSFNYIYFYFEE